MRGQHANFELHHSDQDPSPSPRTVTQQGLTDGSAVKIRIFTPPKDTQIFDRSLGPQKLVRVQPKELFLLKAIYIKMRFAFLPQLNIAQQSRIDTNPFSAKQ